MTALSGAMRERIQKVLATRGIGSRRQVEAWIADGRVTVNGKPAAAGQAVAERDDIRLDGRRLRLGRGVDSAHKGIAYHRPAQEGVRSGTDTAPAAIEKLPRAGGRRWVAVSALPVRDAGLELFVTDGVLAAALTKRGYAITSEFSVRVRGVSNEADLGERMRLKAESSGVKGRIESVKPAGGEGSNRWIQVEAVGLKPRDLRDLLESCGLEANRILRTRFGPIAMDRALARGRSRPLTDAELAALRELADLGPAGSRSPAR